MKINCRSMSSLYAVYWDVVRASLLLPNRAPTSKSQSLHGAPLDQQRPSIDCESLLKLRHDAVRSNQPERNTQRAS